MQTTCSVGRASLGVLVVIQVTRSISGNKERRGNRRHHFGHSVAQEQTSSLYTPNMGCSNVSYRPLLATGVSLSGVDKDCGHEEEEEIITTFCDILATQLEEQPSPVSSNHHGLLACLYGRVSCFVLSFLVG